MTRTAGAIYVVRNPLDVAISYAKHLGMPIERAVHILNMPRFETDNFPNAVYEFYGSWSQHVASWTRRPHRAVFIVRYEGPPCRSPCRLWPAWPNS
jgi:Sulfotransferase domain